MSRDRIPVVRRPGPGRDPGQAAVEFAIALPLVVVLVLGIVQVVLVARDQIAIEVAARAGARAASVSAAPAAAAERAALAATALRPLEIVTTSGSGRVTVVVRVRSDHGVPIVGAAVGPVTLEASVTMATEPPDVAPSPVAAAP